MAAAGRMRIGNLRGYAGDKNMGIPLKQSLALEQNKVLFVPQDNSSPVPIPETFLQKVMKFSKEQHPISY